MIGQVEWFPSNGTSPSAVVKQDKQLVSLGGAQIRIFFFFFCWKSGFCYTERARVVTTFQPHALVDLVPSGRLCSRLKRPQTFCRSDTQGSARPYLGLIRLQLLLQASEVPTRYLRVPFVNGSRFTKKNTQSEKLEDYNLLWMLDKTWRN